MPAEIAQIRAANGEEISVLVERQLGFDRQVAALIVAEERLAALAGPFDRPTDPARRPGEQRIFGVEEVARAEIAAHVLAHAAHLLRRHAEHLSEVEPQLGDAAAAAGVKGVLPARLVVFGRRGARLHRDAGDALHPGVEPHDMGRAAERIGGRGLVADLDIDAEIVRRPIPQLRRRRASPRPRRASPRAAAHRRSRAARPRPWPDRWFRPRPWRPARRQSAPCRAASENERSRSG